MRRFTASTFLLAALATSACDIPTGLPKWDTTFVVQAEGTSVSIAQFLPSSITLTNNNSAFALSLGSSTFGQTLGALCPPCAAFNGQTVPKPAFTGTFGTSISLPADVASASLASGTVQLSIQNNFSFDPIRPSATARGSLTATVRSGTTTLGTVTLNGTTNALPPGSTTQLTVPLNPGTVSGPLDVTVTLDSPAGDPVVVNTNALFNITATPTNILLSSAQVRVQNRQINAAQVTLNVGNIDQFIVDHVKSGALVLTINNPFNVTGAMTMTIVTGSTTITKTVNIAAGQTTVEVPFTQSELQSILGQSNVTLRLSGPVSSNGNVTVTPTQSLSFTALLRLIIGPEA